MPATKKPPAPSILTAKKNSFLNHLRARTPALSKARNPPGFLVSKKKARMLFFAPLLKKTSSLNQPRARTPALSKARNPPGFLVSKKSKDAFFRTLAKKLFSLNHPRARTPTLSKKKQGCFFRTLAKKTSFPKPSAGTDARTQPSEKSARISRK
ncbi:MAG: hypothetical protein L6V86_09895 [Treponema sp.]|nr:MAG: hypothetical protein L6V86_09895 [Treponema sp.]